MSKRLVGGIIGCKYKTSSWHLNGFPDGSVTLGQQYNTGEKPTVMLYTYIKRHAETPDDKNLPCTFFLRHSYTPTTLRGACTYLYDRFFCPAEISEGFLVA